MVLKKDDISTFGDDWSTVMITTIDPILPLAITVGSAVGFLIAMAIIIFVSLFYLRMWTVNPITISGPPDLIPLGTRFDHRIWETGFHTVTGGMNLPAGRQRKKPGLVLTHECAPNLLWYSPVLSTFATAVAGQEKLGGGQ